MKKLIAGIIAVLTIMANNEIVTLVVLAILALIAAGALLYVWAKHEKPKLPGSFDTDWGRK